MKVLRGADLDLIVVPDDGLLHPLVGNFFVGNEAGLARRRKLALACPAIRDEQITDDAGRVSPRDGHRFPQSGVPGCQETDQIQHVAELLVSRQFCLSAYRADHRRHLALELSEKPLQRSGRVVFGIEAVEVDLERHVPRLRTEASAVDKVERIEPTVFGFGVSQTGQVTLWNAMM